MKLVLIELSCLVLHIPLHFLQADFAEFLHLIRANGHSSFAYCQNVFCASDPRHQGLSIALALSQSILEASGGCRAAALQARFRHLCLRHCWKLIVLRSRAYLAQAAATDSNCGSGGPGRSYSYGCSVLESMVFQFTSFSYSVLTPSSVYIR